MHWTAMLAYGSPLLDVQINDNINCVGCGYNLRGLSSRQRCPECGKRVFASLTARRLPESVVHGLQLCAFSYLVPFLLIFVFVIGSPAVAIVIIIAMLFGPIMRLLGSGQLRGDLAAKLPPLIHVSKIFFLFTIAEFVALVFMLVGLLLLAIASIGMGVSLMLVTSVVTLWWTAFAGCMAANATMGMKLASVLGNERLARQFWLVYAALGVAAACILGQFLSRVIVMPQDIQLTMSFIMLIFFAGALILLSLLLFRLASLARQEGGGLDTLFEQQRVGPIQAPVMPIHNQPQSDQS